MLDWNHGFVECSARNNTDVSMVFKVIDKDSKDYCVYTGEVHCSSQNIFKDKNISD